MVDLEDEHVFITGHYQACLEPQPPVMTVILSICF
jgi:hypothetical protein